MADLSISAEQRGLSCELGSLARQLGSACRYSCHPRGGRASQLRFDFRQIRSLGRVAVGTNTKRRSNEGVASGNLTDVPVGIERVGHAGGMAAMRVEGLGAIGNL